MRRFANLLAFTAALLVGGTMITGTADAQVAGGYYVAVPAAQPAKLTLMTRSTPWTLRGDAYHAARAPERDAVLCQLVAKDAGALSAFSVAGRAYDADELARCNARARGAAAGAAAVAAR
jgi:hypothetical protein